MKSSNRKSLGHGALECGELDGVFLPLRKAGRIRKNAKPKKRFMRRDFERHDEYSKDIRFA